MASKHQHLSLYREETVPNGDSFRLGIVVSEWNTDITEKLYQGCYNTLLKHHTKSEHIITVYVWEVMNYLRLHNYCLNRKN